MASENATSGVELVANPWRRRMTWVLRVTVFLQAIGLWRWMTALNSSPLFELLWLPHDAGGLQWLEADALLAQRVVGWATLVCGTLTLFRPCLLFTGPLFLLQVVWTVAMWRGDMGYPLAGMWPSPEVRRLFPFLTQALRMAAPLTLMILDPWRPRIVGPLRTWFGANLLRTAAAVTFIAHGIEAGQHNGRFVDLLIDGAQRLAGYDLPEAMAKQVLSVIAAQDLALAGLCLLCRSRTIMVWMAVWGLATALSRPLAYGIDAGLHDLLIRASHCGGPLAVAILWQMSRDAAAETQTPESPESPEQTT